MTAQVVPAEQFSPRALAECFTAAFEGYLAGPVVQTAATLPAFLRRQGADLSVSRCVLLDGELAGLALVGEFDGKRRVGGMGLRREARGTGASRVLLQRVIDEAQHAGLRALELEVFAQNTPALRLYRSMGFVEQAALWGFVHEPGEPDAALGQAHPGHGATTSGGDAPGAAPVAVGTAEAAEWLLSLGREELPYQASGHALRHADAATRAWRAGQALLAFAEAPSRRLGIALLFDADSGQADARRLLAALLRAYPGHLVRVPQLMREEVAARALRESGFTPLALHQLQMRLALR